MARKPRIEFPGAVYHVTARGNAQADIYIGDEDRIDFLQILADTVKRCGWILHAYCLMTNHYHLLLETPNANLGKGMQLLAGTYTNRFNRRNSRVGHVFQGRYKAILIEKESHLLEVARYVALNPVRANMVAHAGDYKWSSYNATISKASVPTWLSVDEVLARFHRQRLKAYEAFARFVDGPGGESPFKEIQWGLALGGEKYLEALKPKIEEAIGRDGSSTVKWDRPALTILFEDITNKAERNLKMLEAHERYGYTLTEIGEQLGMHMSSVSKTLKKERGRW